MYDVIVVGAGPAGSMIAYEMARSGYRTLLLEKFSIPREKACGGAAMYRGLRLIGPSFPRHLVEREIYGLRFRFSDGTAAEFTSDRLLGVTTERARFDEFLARRAEQAGAELREKTRVIGVQLYPSDVEAVTEGGSSVRARFLVGADGASSTVARATGLRPHRKDLNRAGLGMESVVEIGEDRVIEALGGNPSVLEIYPVEGRVSYGWVFPRKTSLAVGIAGAASHMSSLRSLFDSFVSGVERRLGFRLPILKRRVSFLGADGHRQTNVFHRVILVGDAAGFVDPMMGEGISYAMRSSLLAADVLREALDSDHNADATLAKYDSLCKKTFAADFSIASWAGMRGTGFARSLLNKASEMKFSSEIMAAVARGEMGYSDIPPRVILRLPYHLPRLIREYISDHLASTRSRN